MRTDTEQGTGTRVPAEAWPVAALAAAALTACGGGGGDDPKPADTVKPPPETAQCLSTQPSPASAGTSAALAAPTYATAARFLAQIGLGATVADLQAIVAAGNFTTWLDAQLSRPANAVSVFQWAKDRGFADLSNFGTDRGVDDAVWARLLGSPDVVRQRMALAWSQIFVVSASNMATPWGQFAAMAYWDVLEAHGLGNFRSLLRAVTLSPAMGVYLNMRGSRKADAGSGRQPDENYAREVLQLFTIGLNQLRADGTEVLDGCGQPVATYTNDDISGLAAVFTGWDFDRPSDLTPDHLARPMVHDATGFAEGAKRFLGVTAAAGLSGTQALDVALDTIFNHPNVAPYIARRLIQQLTTSNPSAAYVARVAQAFADNGSGVRGDLKAVVRAIVLDAEARPTLTGTLALTHGKLREPVLRLVHWARLFRVNATDGRWQVQNLAPATALAQSPLRAPSVFNFFRPGYVPPNTELAQAGLVAPEFQITDDTSVIGYANFMQRVIGFGDRNVEPDYATDGWLARAADPDDLVAWLNVGLAGGNLLPETVAQIIEAITPIDQLDVNAYPIDTPLGPRWSSGRLARVVTAVFLIVCSPDFLVQR
ncbi:MAG TPA: DUF1800 domain-containing protein [Candidatus Aquabacterium excrementipullorum]|nr:DUF1800 domain-containing protein [Candidatus Aquabacterium excrementipullorum]